MAIHFANKISAAFSVLKYKYSNDLKDLETAESFLDESVRIYTILVKLTENNYLYANSMQTQQRRIPMRGVNGTFKHWKEMLPVFTKELLTFRYKIDSLKNNSGTSVRQVIAFQNAKVVGLGEEYKIEEGAKLFSDTSFVISKFAAELKDLNALQLPFKQQQRSGTTINFTTDKPVKVLVGFFKTQRAAFTTDTIFLKEPELETNASADDYGQAEIKISNAVAIDGMPPVSIHAYNFKAGTHQLKLGKGVCLVLGFVDGQQVIPIYDAMLMSDPKNKNIDWLFE